MGWRDLDGLPALGVQRSHVAVPLPERQVDVNRDARDVGEQPFRQAGAGAADERATVHAEILSQRGQQVTTSDTSTLRGRFHFAT